LQFRLAGPEDAAALAEFHNRVWHATYASIAPPEAVAALGIGRRRVQWAARMADPDPPSAVLIAESGDRLAGICAVSPAMPGRFAGALEADHLYVDPDLQGQGLGRRLLQWAQSHAASCGLEGVVLCAVRQNAAAIAFYTACGGEVAGMQTDKGPLWKSENVVFHWPRSQPD
jgi:GNAT superfamily N-acetyltransferase